MSDHLMLCKLGIGMLHNIDLMEFMLVCSRMSTFDGGLC